MQIRDRRSGSKKHLVAAQPLVAVDHHRHDPMSVGAQDSGELPVDGVAGLGAHDPGSSLLDPVQGRACARCHTDART